MKNKNLFFLSKKTLILVLTLTFLTIIMSLTTNSLTEKDIFKTLKLNDNKGEAIFTLNNPSTTNINKESLSFKFNEVCGEIKSYEVLINNTCYKLTPIYEQKLICEEISINETQEPQQYCHNTTTIKEYKNISYTCYKPINNIPPNNKDYKIIANIKEEWCYDGTYGHKIDWIPTLNYLQKNYEMRTWAWWNTSYNYRRNISCTNIDDDYPIIINGSNGVTLNGSKQVIRTYCKGEGMALYYNDNTDYAIANDTTILPFDVLQGEGNSYNPESVYPNDWMAYYPGESVANSIGKDHTSNQENGTVSNNINSISSGKIGNTFNTSLNSATEKIEISNDFFGSLNTFTLEGWIYRTADADDFEGIMNSPTIFYLYIYNPALPEKLYATYHDGSSWGSNMESDTETPLNKWVLVTWTHNDTHMFLRMNGTQVASQARSASVRPPSGTIELYGSGTSDFFQGRLDEWVFKNSYTTPEQTNMRLNNVKGTSGYGNIGIEENKGLGGYLIVNLNAPSNGAWTEDNTPTFNWTPISSNVINNINCTWHHTVGVNNTETSMYNLFNNTQHNYTSPTLNDGVGTWYVNCTDGTNSTNSSTRTLTIDTTPPIISNFNIEPSTIYTNNDSNANITSTDNLGSITANLTCFVEGISIHQETDVSLTNNTAHNFNTIGSDNYSKNEILTCNVTIWDNLSNTNTSSVSINISDTPPTPPTNITGIPSTLYAGINITINATGSTDNDADPILYYTYSIYNLNDTTWELNWTNNTGGNNNNNTAEFYVTHNNIGDTLRFSSYAVTSTLNSTNYTTNKLIQPITIFIYTYDMETGIQIQNFSTNITLNTTINYGSNLSINEFYNQKNLTNNYTTTLLSGINTTYTFNVNATGNNRNYSIRNFSIFINSSNVSVNHNLTLNLSIYPINSLVITIYNELTSNQINELITINLVSSNLTNNYNTSNGEKAITELLADTYNIKFNGDNYSIRYYVVTIIEGTTQQLNAYLLPTNESTNIGVYVLTTENDILPNSTIIIRRQYENNWVTITQKRSDSAGYALFYLEEGTEYRWIISSEGYSTRTFQLEPYNINQPYYLKLSTETISPFNNIYNAVQYFISPNPNNNTLNQGNITFSITTVSIGGTIIYTYVTCNGTTNNITGSPAGATASLTFNLSNYDGTWNCTYGFYATGSYYPLLIIPIFYYLLGEEYTPLKLTLLGASDKFKSEVSNAWLGIVAFLVILILTITLYQLTYNNTVSSITAILGVIVFIILGWLPISASIFSIAIIGFIYFTQGRREA